MSGLETLFLICAIAGGALFLLRLALQFLGGDTDLESDVPDGLDGALGDSDVSFKVISFQGIMAFLMIFGLVGLGLKRTDAANDTQAVILAAAGGVGMMLLQAKLMVYLLGLQSSGTLDIRDAVGREGDVYLTIPADGAGKVEIIVQNRLKIFDAVSRGSVEIPTGERVKVTEIQGANMLVVERLGS